MRAPQSRPAFARLQFLAREIRTKNEIPNTFQVARRWECHHKTINRDLDLLRNFFDYPLAYNPTTIIVTGKQIGRAHV